jgi:hypothetical protein
MFSALRVLKSKDAIIYVALKMKFPSSLGIVNYKKKRLVHFRNIIYDNNNNNI